MMEASKNHVAKAPPEAAPIQYQYRTMDQTMSIINANDARLVTDFTLFTMHQMS
jgi:hypothetical protein